MKKHQKLMLRYGGIIGGASIVLTMLQYTLGAYNGKPLTVFLFGILPILLLTFFIFLGIYQSKERSFRQMMKMGLGISIFFAVIAAIFCDCIHQIYCSYSLGYPQQFAIGSL